MEKMITDEIAEQVKEMFDQLDKPVEILFFGIKDNCEYCDETQQLIEEVVHLSDLLTAQYLDLELDAELAENYHVDKAPTLVITARDGGDLVDFGVRMLGAPAGHEFTSLIHDLIYVSKRHTDLNDEAKNFLKTLEKPVLLQVFVTPTCPYCPQAVLLAHQMAIESDLVEAEMVEATEFHELADKFMVRGVPQTTINSGKATVVGAVPSTDLIAQIQNALAK